MMDLMKMMQDPATAQAMAAAPTMLADLLDTLHQIRDAANLQNRLTARILSEQLDMSVDDVLAAFGLPSGPHV